MYNNFMEKFTHLNLHTNYSLLDSSGKIPEMLARAKEVGMDSMAITDRGVLFGAIEFYEEAKKLGIKPIIGCEINLTKTSRHEKLKHDRNDSHSLILLAKNESGYKNLIRIVSDSFVEGFYYKPRVDKELLERFSKGLICLSGGLRGEIASAVLSGDIELAKQAALYYKSLFGKENFYLEIQDHGYENQVKLNKALIQLSKELDIELVATNDVHYTYAEDALAHDVLICIQTGKKVDDVDRMRYESAEFYLKSPDEMKSLFYYLPKALENTNKIADMCNLDFEFNEYKLPKFYIKDIDKSAYLRELCFKGLDEKYGELSTDERKELGENLDYELSVIESMGFVDYFLITWDFIKYAKENDIPVGPGRGSAAGSLVAYTLDITEVDPVKYDLLFERFLNPERVTMPDIDIDFCYERRGEVIDYVIEKYGSDRVAQIITFGTMAPRAVIRDVGRVLDLPYGLVDKVAKLIPAQLKITIDKALDMSSDLRAMYEGDIDVRKLIDMAKRLEGIKRHASTHAAGVVICDKPVHDYVPLSLNDDIITTQYTMTTLEKLGLLKMDFLGLRTLTVIKYALDNIEKTYAKRIDIKNIDFCDKATFELISSGNTDGVFQLESAGMKSFMKKLKPEGMEDIIAGISLYRPGPMDLIPEYIKNRMNPEDIVYDCPELKPILEKTYGVIVYQEQVMEIVRSLAGYSYGRSDLIRRAMSKKKHDVMERERRIFIYGDEEGEVEGAKARGIDEKVANSLFDKMMAFAEYAFNKSHAAAYGVISYQTAWLKTHYPKEYMAALLTSIMNNTDKVAEYIFSMREMGIEILSPDINEGFYNFSVAEDGIRFGLAAVKNVGRHMVDEIVAERERAGKYSSFTDFIKRMIRHGINKRVLENLILAGAFDSLGGSRKTYMQNYARTLDEESFNKKNSIEGQINLFESVGKKDEGNADMFKHTDEIRLEYKLMYEKDVLGLYLSGHPLDKYMKEIRNIFARNKKAKKSTDFRASDESEASVYDGELVHYIGIVVDVSLKVTKNDREMAFVTLEDLYGNLELVVFPKVWAKHKDDFALDEILYIKGKASTRDGQDGKILVDEVYKMEDILVDTCYLAFEDMTDFEEKKDLVEMLLKASEGNVPVIYFIKDGRMMKKSEFKIGLDEAILEELKIILAKENIKIRVEILKI